MLFPYGSPEWRLNDLVMAELARHYGLPMFGTAGATDSKLVDAQAGMEYASSLLVAALAGTNLIHDVGYLDAGLLGSLESIVLGAEQIRWVKRFLSGVEVSEETLGLGIVDEVGPGGHFLDHAHTLRHLRRTVWTPYALDRQKWDGWARDGAKDLAVRAREVAQAALDSHEGAGLDDATCATLVTLAETH
jgi:trimethylamine--corrinoid protein Co-methyltransferase